SDVPLDSYAAVCAGARLTVANDSGPMHLATASGGTTLGIFGVGEPERTSPWGGQWLGSATTWPNVDQVRARIDDLLCS
ncbi:MAG: glycosyltransferase family 9 protein, partial [Planctomycetota bacterium]